MINLIQKKQNDTPHFNIMLSEEHLANKIFVNNVAMVVVMNQTLNICIIVCCYNETESQSYKGLRLRLEKVNTDDSSCTDRVVV